jgi:uncharacterized membrane protein
MAIRLQELHSAIVHFPITLLPLAIGLDLAGDATDTPWMLEAGRRGIGLAAAGAAGAALTGLIAQEEVNVEGETMDTLITHRNLNLAATVVAALMAAWRTRRHRPSPGYLGVGLAGIGLVSYTAYLGGTLVYQHGVGVAPAGGQYQEDPPELGAQGQTAAFFGNAATDLAHGATHLAQELKQGRVAPSLGIGPKAPRPQKPAREAAIN